MLIVFIFAVAVSEFHQAQTCFVLFGFCVVFLVCVCVVVVVLTAGAADMPR